MKKANQVLFLGLLSFLTGNNSLNFINAEEESYKSNIETIKVENSYEYGREYITSQPGNGFAFSISGLSEPKHITGNALGIRIRNNCKTPAKIKMGVNASSDKDGENATNYQTLTANGKNKNLAIKLSGKRTFIESRNGITEIPAYFDGILFMDFSRFSTLAESLDDFYICNFRFGGALCDNKETDLILYELFDANVNEAQDEYGKNNFDLYEASIISSLGTAETFKEIDSTFWGAYSYELGTPEKRAFDKSVTSIQTKKTSEILYPLYDEKWIGDVKVLETFDKKVETAEDLYNIYANTGAKHYLSCEKIGDYDALGILTGDWELDYTNATFTNLSCYALDGNWADFSNANGITLLIKNFEDHFININVEFFGIESDGAQFRWSINFPGSRMYVYDLNTLEQYCIISNSRIFIPPNFEGWLRIPFSQYEPNQGVDTFSWVLDLDRYEVDGIYITCSMKTNSNCKFAIANLGLYYENFKQNSFFEDQILSFKDCLELENYKEKMENEKN